METCFVNLVEPGDKVVVCQNGVFGWRMKENVERCGGIPIMIQEQWGRAINPNKVIDALIDNPDAKIVAFVHAETSTGAESNADVITSFAHKADCLVIVDAVTSLGGMPLKVDEWNVDAIYSGTQKCLSCTPGLSPVSFNERALEKIKNRKTKVQSWFLDLNLVMEYWGGEAKRTYHHTAPINALYGLHEALLMLQEEGLEAAWRRHLIHYLGLRAGLEAMGLKYTVPVAERLPQLNVVGVPEGVDDAAVRAALLNDYQIEIGGGLGQMAGKIWRIGLMGQSSTLRNVLTCLEAMEDVLSRQGMQIEKGAAVVAAEKRMEDYKKQLEQAAARSY
jgi:alanine-glyoxylate transaminase/serine-glyoxylate transaminase/serine-pyruvate transaminase